MPGIVGAATGWVGWLPENASTFGEQVDRLFYLILLVTGIMFVLTEGAILVFIIRYRHQLGRRAVYVHDHRTMETVWTAIPALVLIFLAVAQQSTWTQIKVGLPQEEHPDTIPIRMVARQFNWNFWYPGPDRRFGTPDDFDSGALVVPVSDAGLDDRWNTPDDRSRRVLLVMRSRDVIHSVFMPHMRVKQDVVPGMETRLWFAAIRKGKFEIVCAELCGAQHYAMKGDLRVVSPAEFEEFVEGNQGSFSSDRQDLWKWWREHFDRAGRLGS